MSIRAVVFVLFDTVVDLRMDQLPEYQLDGRSQRGTTGLLHQAVLEHQDISIEDFSRALGALDKEKMQSLLARGFDEASIERAEEKLDAPSLEAMAERHKQAGNEAFKERDYVQASVSYMQGIEALKAAKQSAETVAVLTACYSNRAACQVRFLTEI